MNPQFSLQRMLLLIKNDVMVNHRSWLITSAAIAGVLFVFAVVFDQLSPVFYTSSFTSILFILGLIMSSRAFQELQDKTRNEAYLLLPASALEKTASRLFIVTLGLIIYLLVFFTALSVVIGLVRMLLNAEAYFFNPFNSGLWLMILIYLHVQSYFFLGAAWFKKLNLVKTIVALNLLGIAFTVFGALISAIILQPLSGLHLEFHEVLAELSNYKKLYITLMVFVPVFLSVCCWGIAWQRIKETQVSDGI